MWRRKHYSKAAYIWTSAVTRTTISVPHVRLTGRESANRHEDHKRLIGPRSSYWEGIFNSFAKPKQQQLAAPRSWQESAIRRNGEFMRTHFEPSKHLAVGWINLDLSN
jgi:hypothetical protein